MAVQVQVKKASRPNRDLIANCRVTPDEREHLKKVAAANGETLSELIRRTLKEAGAMPQEVGAI